MLTKEFKECDRWMTYFWGSGIRVLAHAKCGSLIQAAFPYIARNMRPAWNNGFAPGGLCCCLIRISPSRRFALSWRGCVYPMKAEFARRGLYSPNDARWLGWSTVIARFRAFPLRGQARLRLRRLKACGRFRERVRLRQARRAWFQESRRRRRLRLRFRWGPLLRFSSP